MNGLRKAEANFIVTSNTFATSLLKKMNFLIVEMDKNLFDYYLWEGQYFIKEHLFDYVY